MTSKDINPDQELLDRYRRASDTDPAAPSDAVRSAILAESRRVAGQLASKESLPAFDTSRPAANDSRWKITAFGTAGAALLAALLIAPRYWESLPPAQRSTATVTAPTAAPAAAPESKSENSDAAGKSAATELSPTATALARVPAPPPKLDKKNAQLALNYAPAPLALRPAPAAPSADAQRELAPANGLVPAPGRDALIGGYSENAGAGLANSERTARAAQSGALSMSADRSARAALERNALEPVNLQSASAAGDLAQATLLLDQGAAVDARDTLGRTPLLFAVAQNRIEVVRLLLARGADPNAADNAGLTPLQQARNKDFQDIAALLERAGAR
jgi:hypothetical protein